MTDVTAVSGRPLDGIRVLDLSRVLAGPIGTRMLCDLGADVVKVEPPEGDVTRKFGIARGDHSGYYDSFNAGKRDICVDLNADGGPDLIRRLAAQADVVIENFRPGVLASFGLDWEALAADRDDLVMLSISGFGQVGPESQRAAYAGIIHAESGFLHRQARTTRQPAADAQLSIADVNAGLHGIIGVLAALRVRDATGVGQHIDIAMVDALLVGDDYMYWADEGVEAARGGGEIWDATGGPVIVMGDFKWVWKCASEILGLQDPTPPGASLKEKITLRRQAWADYLVSFGDRAPMLAALDRANLAWGDVKSGMEALESPTLAHRDSLVDVDDRSGGTRRVVQSPYRFSRSTSGVRGPAPGRGEHNREVLADWLDAGDEHDALASAGVLLSQADQ